MVILEMQDALCNYLGEILSDEYLLNGKRDGELKQIKFYTQNLPMPPNVKIKTRDTPLKYQDFGEADFENLFPFIIVRSDNGEREKFKNDSLYSNYRVNIKLIIGIYDNSQDCQGYRDAANIIDKIIFNLERDKIIDQKYLLCDRLKWVLPDENYWPLFYGFMDLVFETGYPQEKLKAAWI